MDKSPSIEQHNTEIFQNLECWKQKPILQKIYKDFYEIIAGYLSNKKEGLIVELGSGIGNIKSVIPYAICTDLFPNPWIDQVENAYSLSFQDNSVSDIILFDVFHHIEFPGDVLNELYRVVNSKGRVIIFEPAVSLFGLLVYGVFHHEPISLFSKIKWQKENNISIESLPYYSAQGNSSRIFKNKKYKKLFSNQWEIIKLNQLSAFTYAASGGYSKKQLYPDKMYPFLKKTEKILDLFPFLFATRNLIVLEKK